jgi:alginate O-acetyltransferase complex protein AlgI
MLFNSPEFLVFLVIVFVTYWKLNHRNQNILLVIASYVFYGWWDWRFLILIFISTLFDFTLGKKIEETNDEKKRKTYLFFSLGASLILLGIFKYFNFFALSAQALLMSLGFQNVSLTTLNVVLPVGISFYTFQTMSYCIEIYQRKTRATYNFIDFMGFVSFFPQLVAGPIERASHLIGQFTTERVFDRTKADDGLRQILWGFFKKIVVADNLAIVVNNIYADPNVYNGGELFLATIFFAFQIYCDFSGYSDIALGTGKLFGFNLSRNFAYPYFSRNISEFWHRWHITLSSWFRDYVFIPLGGSRVVTKSHYITNIIITFTLSGLWHGANWTFVLWGFLNGLYYIPYILAPGFFNKEKSKKFESAASLKDLPTILTTFILVSISWVFFRSSSVNEALQIIYRIFNSFSLSAFNGNLKQIAIVLVLLLIEWSQRDKEHPLVIGDIPKTFRWLIYFVVLGAILFYGEFNYTPFIYFQF